MEDVKIEKEKENSERFDTRRKLYEIFFYIYIIIALHHLIDGFYRDCAD
jgi:hypothetical protein